MSGTSGHRDRFDRFATAAARWTGHASAFSLASVFVIVWAVSGPLFGYSNTWQLVINTATTVLTFLMVFVIQNTLNRDSLALHVKLDELLRVSEQARNALIGAERLSEKQIEALEEDEEQRKAAADASQESGAD
jgi:low affinity Fe/Cu permease